MEDYRGTGNIREKAGEEGRREEEGDKSFNFFVWYMCVFMFACVYSRACMQMYIDVGVLCQFLAPSLCSFSLARVSR